MAQAVSASSHSNSYKTTPIRAMPTLLRDLRPRCIPLLTQRGERGPDRRISSVRDLKPFPGLLLTLELDYSDNINNTLKL